MSAQNFFLEEGGCSRGGLVVKNCVFRLFGEVINGGNDELLLSGPGPRERSHVVDAKCMKSPMNGNGGQLKVAFLSWESGQCRTYEATASYMPSQ